MPEYAWDVLLPGEDLPRRITTDYLVSEGEEITVDSRTWIVGRVDIDESIEPTTGLVSVVQPEEPTPPPASGPPPPR